MEIKVHVTQRIPFEGGNANVQFDSQNVGKILSTGLGIKPTTSPLPRRSATEDDPPKHCLLNNG